MLRICIGIILIVGLLASIPARGDVNEDLKGIHREIKEKKLLLKKTRKVETEVSTELSKIDNSLREKAANLDMLAGELRGVEGELVRTQGRMETTRLEAERKRDQIRRRLVALYKSGEVGSVRVYFSSGSLPQMVEDLRYMRAVLDNDRQLFAAYTAKIEELRWLKDSLEKDAARKERIRGGIEQKKREIEAEKLKKAAYLAKVREQKKGYQTSLRELEANARRLQAMVERLEAQSRKSYTKNSTGKHVFGSGPVLPPIPDKGFGAQKGRLSMPVRGELVGSYGRHKHPEFNSYTVSNGISIAAPAGTEIHSVFDGRVIFADYFKGYGNMVIVDHGGGFFSLYAHASRMMKKVGSLVSRNEVIASVGDVDSPRGPMLYFEIRYQGKPVDPTLWIR